MYTNIEESVITLFKQIGYDKNQYISQLVARQALDQRSIKVLNVPFKLAIANDIISQCQNQKIEISPQTIGKTLASAYTILKHRLDLLNSPKGFIQDCMMAIQKNRQKLQNSNLMSEDSENLHKLLRSQIQRLEGQLQELKRNSVVFQQQITIIQRLFIYYKTDYKIVSDVNPKYLSVMFYLTSIGILLEFVVVQLRPGWISILIYLQVYFLLLIGYYSKNAVKILVATNVLSLFADGVALFLLQFLEMLANIDWEANKMKPVTLTLLKVLLGLSLFIRIAILFISCKFLEPPLVKINFQIAGNIFQLNTRVKSERMNFENYQNIDI